MHVGKVYIEDNLMSNYTYRLLQNMNKHEKDNNVEKQR